MEISRKFIFPRVVKDFEKMKLELSRLDCIFISGIVNRKITVIFKALGRVVFVEVDSLEVEENPQRIPIPGIEFYSPFQIRARLAKLYHCTIQCHRGEETEGIHTEGICAKE